MVGVLRGPAIVRVAGMHVDDRGAGLSGADRRVRDLRR